MILITVHFSETNRAYDFRADSSVPVGQLVEDMVGMIAQRDHLNLSRDPGLFLLCRRSTGEIFGRETTLRQNGVRSGDEVMLV